MEAVDPPQGDPLGEGLERLGRSPMLTIGPGALSVVIGVLVLVPDDTAVVIGWLFAIHLVVTGIRWTTGRSRLADRLRFRWSLGRCHERPLCLVPVA